MGLCRFCRCYCSLRLQQQRFAVHRNSISCNKMRDSGVFMHLNHAQNSRHVNCHLQITEQKEQSSLL